MSDHTLTDYLEANALLLACEEETVEAARRIVKEMSAHEQEYLRDGCEVLLDLLRDERKRY